jgi:hypothetical protein
MEAQLILFAANSMNTAFRECGLLLGRRVSKARNRLSGLSNMRMENLE